MAKPKPKRRMVTRVAGRAPDELPAEAACLCSRFLPLTVTPWRECGLDCRRRGQYENSRLAIRHAVPVSTRVSTSRPRRDVPS